MPNASTCQVHARARRVRFAVLREFVEPSRLPVTSYSVVKIFLQARNFALRARGLPAISLTPGMIGRRVKISTAFLAPQLHVGRRGGHWQRPESFPSVRLMIRSSSE